MIQIALFDTAAEAKANEPVQIGKGLSLQLHRKYPSTARLYRNGIYLKGVDLTDKPAFRLFVLDAVDLGAKKSALAEALNISRQSIHNYEQTRKHFGIEGLIHNQKPGPKRKAREEISAKRLSGNKAKQLAQIRRQENERQQQELAAAESETELNFSSEQQDAEQALAPADQLFNDVHEWKKSRYAGVFVYIPILLGMWRWAHLIAGQYGAAYKIFMVFVLMAARNIRSIEQLKNIHRDEAGAVLGLRKLPAKEKLWTWFYTAAQKGKSAAICVDYFVGQVRRGLVGSWMWFIDGHLLPYTGKEPIRYSYSTQRRMTLPGQTNFVTCDGSGRVVDFQIEEGKGDLRNQIRSMALQWRDRIGRAPVMVFDREGDGKEFFWGLKQDGTSFITWEKGVDGSKLATIADDKYSDELTVNGTDYKCFETTRKYRIEIVCDEGGEPCEHTFTLRRIHIWNTRTNHRTCGVSNTDAGEFNTAACAKGILGRWGASENTFKHLNDRHPLHYHPGFKLTDSANQQIDNPLIKPLNKRLGSLKKTLGKLYKKLAQSKPSLTKAGVPRKNSVHAHTSTTIAQCEQQCRELSEQKQNLPEKVDASTLEKYGTLQAIDNEGKNLFDFVTCSVWNARKELVDWLRTCYGQERDLVDLFYAITETQGWVRSTSSEVTVRLEALPVPARAHAQEQLCRKLTALNAQTPAGKRLIIEVGDPPI